MARVGWQTARDVFLMCSVLILTGANDPPGRSGHVLDEARQAGRSAASLPAATEDYFHDMDGAVALTKDSGTGLDPVVGRNMWLVWSGGNDQFWDTMTRSTFGAFDLLKIVAYDPDKPIDRAQRWKELGLINEPCFDAPTGPDPQRFGLMFDVRRPECAADPFEDEAEVSRGACRRTRQDRAGRFAVWLRHRHRRTAAFPESRLRRSGEGEVERGRYYTKAIHDKNLVRPYRVGMSCGFCHVGPSPVQSACRSRQSAMGRTSAPPSERNICGWTGCSSIAPIRTTSCSSSCTRTARVRWIRRWSRPTTSTIHGR